MRVAWKTVHLSQGQTERLAHVSDRRPPTEGDDVGDHGGPIAPVALVDVLDYALALLMLDIQIDVGWLAALRRHKPLKQQTLLEWGL